MRISLQLLRKNGGHRKLRYAFLLQFLWKSQIGRIEDN